MRKGTTLASFGTLALSMAWAFGNNGCRAVVDSGVEYHACDNGQYAEEFAPGTTEKNLLERCWFFDNVKDPDDLFIEDDDMIIRVGEGAAWDLEQQGPFAFRRLEKDFVLAVRVEILEQGNSKHCLDPADAVGIVVRREPEWVSLFMSLFTPDPPPPNLDCAGLDEDVPPVKATVRSRGDVWGAPFESTGVEQTGIGFDAEADIAVCRLSGTLTFYYRDIKSPVDQPEWNEIGAGLPFGEGVVDVGVTVAGPNAAAHYQWVEFSNRVGTDGCIGELEKFQVPPFE